MRWPSDKPWNAATRLMFAIGILVLAGAGWSTWSTATFLSEAVHLSGTISEPLSHPRIQFTTLDGTAVEFQAHGAASGYLGDPVPVAYLPNDPKGTAQADMFWANWMEPLGLVWIGLCLTLLPTFGVEAGFRGGRW